MYLHGLEFALRFILNLLNIVQRRIRHWNIWICLFHVYCQAKWLLEISTRGAISFL